MNASIKRHRTAKALIARIKAGDLVAGKQLAAWLRNQDYGTGRDANSLVGIYARATELIDGWVGSRTRRDKNEAVRLNLLWARDRFLRICGEAPTVLPLGKQMEAVAVELARSKWRLCIGGYGKQSEWQPFLATIDAAPLADGPKLVFADKLEETGHRLAERIRDCYFAKYLQEA